LVPFYAIYEGRNDAKLAMSEILDDLKRVARKFAGNDEEPKNNLNQTKKR
jgi:hypothetical protein